ncbi:hypothetical protein [Fodinicurvata sp. EGI_FJ10296]|uniref:hypothetical protein n=1 Tax=Fodinicurvata sp. EGI_FJ10296 TaxID=3231908 RepID=UPI0034530952
MRRNVISMPFLLGTAAAMPVLAQERRDAVVEGTMPFTQDVLIEGLEGPWEVTWGTDATPAA